MLGFPTDPAFRSAKLNGWRAVAFACAGTLATAAPPLQTFDPRSNIIIEVDLNALTDSSGSPAFLPDPLNGISGGLIVRVELSGRTHSIVAVQTSIFKTRDTLRIKGTYWSRVLGLIEGELNGITPATRLALPRKRF